MSQQTAMELLFEEFKALSEGMRQAGDETFANTIDFLCKRKEAAMVKEKEQIMKAYDDGAEESWDSGKYYNETYNK